VLIDGASGIIAGHSRVLAARKLGLSEVPVIELTNLSEAEKRADVLADNRLADQAGWDRELLALELGDLGDLGIDLGDLGFDGAELDALLNHGAPNAREEATPEVPEVPVSRPGDLWMLGKHRLICGDATDRATVERLLDGVRPHLMATDPPFGVNYDPDWRNRAGASEIRRTVHSSIHPDDLEVVLAAARRAMDPGVRANENYAYRVRRLDTGELRWLRGHGIAQFDGEGSNSRAVLYAGSVQDITGRELTRQSLAASEERLRLAIDAAEMAVWDLDLEAGVVAHSPELNRLLGFPEDARPSLDELRSRYAPGERERLEAEGAAARARGETSLQTRVRYIVPGRGEVTYDHLSGNGTFLWETEDRPRDVRVGEAVVTNMQLPDTDTCRSTGKLVLVGIVE